MILRTLPSHTTLTSSFLIGDKEIKAHRAILWCASEHFKGMLATPMKESTTNVIHLDDVEYDHFLCILQFLYTGQTIVTPDDAAGLFELADRFLLEPLKSQCEHFLCLYVDKDNVEYLLDLATRHSGTQLQSQCERFQSNLSK